jgi:hypothetical protein
MPTWPDSWYLMKSTYLIPEMPQLLACCSAGVGQCQEGGERQLGSYVLQQLLWEVQKKARGQSGGCSALNVPQGLWHICRAVLLFVMQHTRHCWLLFSAFGSKLGLPLTC